MHIMVLIMIWSLAYTSWSLMGRFGLVSLGHGAFMGIGAYVTALLWNYAGLTPWLGIPIALATVAVVAFIVGYPCFRFRIVGHYFALVTLALSEIVRQVIMATRDYTGGSLGFTPTPHGDGFSLYALQFADREVFYYVAFAAWVFGLWVWRRVDRSMDRFALEAISEDEDASPPDPQTDRPGRQGDVVEDGAVGKLERVEREAVAIGRWGESQRAAGVVARRHDHLAHDLAQRQ
ncbi:MAG: branched-chain amino acid ABC transporter permease, partial [Hyphomicrobiales bacterium]|nr:branched-chain amino acid ABC transporter permease [Hyphomicrobiales bacterium]